MARTLEIQNPKFHPKASTESFRTTPPPSSPLQKNIFEQRRHKPSWLVLECGLLADIFVLRLNFLFVAATSRKQSVGLSQYPLANYPVQTAVT